MSKTFLFAGASSLIAVETAGLLSEKGHSVIGISTKPNCVGYEAVHPIENYESGVYPVIEHALDGIVYFPGTINLKPFSRLTNNEIHADMAINTFGAVSFTQAYLKNLKLAPSGSLVFISTVAVGTGMPYHSSIAMAKGAIEGLTRSLAAELAPWIRVNCIAPSLVDTPLAARLVNTPEKAALMQKKNPLHKIGTPKEVAQAIVFLLTEHSSWITGQIIALDGGMGSLRNP